MKRPKPQKHDWEVTLGPKEKFGLVLRTFTCKNCLAQASIRTFRKTSLGELTNQDMRSHGIHKDCSIELARAVSES